MSQSIRTTLEQGRAAYAYACAEKGKNLKNASEYKAYSRKVPMLIKTNGLGATFAFMKSKRGEAYNLLYQQTAEWISDKELFNYNKNQDLVKHIIDLESSEYRTITIEILAFFNWLRRFAEGLIKDKDEKTKG